MRGSTLDVRMLSATVDFSRFLFVLLADQITVIGDEMSVETSRIANVCLKLNT